jgi:hypothetical protein
MPLHAATDCVLGVYLQANDVLDHSAALSDVEKAITEYWADGPGSSVQPPGHWMQFAADAAVQKVGQYLGRLAALCLAISVYYYCNQLFCILCAVLFRG